MKRNEVIVSGRQKDKRVLERIKESNVRLYKKWINIDIDTFAYQSGSGLGKY
jgi:hemerythrin superfamily protein